MLIRFLQLWICLSAVNPGLAQVFDDFSDGDFTVDPTWIGDVAEFEVLDNRLNSKGPDAAATLYLSTPNSLVDNTIWEFLIDLEFNGTSSNFVRIYLVSNQSDLENNPSGYFIHLGQTNEDHIKFYRNDTGIVSELFEGKSRVERQRMVFDVIKAEMSAHIHAMELKTMTPNETK